MAEFDDTSEKPARDMGEQLRTWRLFVSFMKWHVVGLGILLLVLLVFRTHS